MRWVARAAPFPLLVAALLGMGPAAGPPARFDPVVFEEAAEARGARFVTNSSRTPREHQPRSIGAGAALPDHDGGGWLPGDSRPGRTSTPPDTPRPHHPDRLLTDR